MGLFSLFSKEEQKSYPYEIPGYLPAKEIERLEKIAFGGGETDSKTAWLLAFGAPMLVKDGQPANQFPQYEGGKLNRMKAAFQQNWGPIGKESMYDELDAMLMGSCCEKVDPIFRVTRTTPVSQWENSAYRMGKYSDKQQQKLAAMESFYRRLGQYGMKVPEKTLYAYDLCRGANLICISKGIGVIEENEALELLEEIAWVANQYYDSWESFYGAYVTGRIFWLWAREQFLALNTNGDSNVCRVLIHSPKGICGKLSFGERIDSCQEPAGYYVPTEE